MRMRVWRGGGGELFDERTGDRIEEDARAFSTGDLADAGYEVFLRGGDDMIGAELRQLFALL